MYKYLTSTAAASLDQALMKPPYGFHLATLMELAGFAVAQAVYDTYATTAITRAIIIAGPGNNGGDGYVAARHLRHFGFQVAVLAPAWPPSSSRSSEQKTLYGSLIQALEELHVPVYTGADDTTAWAASGDGFSATDVAIDAVLGFGAKGAPRAPYDALLAAAQDKAGAMVAVDIPSGWDVDSPPALGDTSVYWPDLLVSLTAPKLCTVAFDEHVTAAAARSSASELPRPKHVIGGRFLPPALASEFELDWLPSMPGTAQYVEWAPGESR